MNAGMSAFTSDWPGLLALAFVLGLKHGLDADHLTAVDGLTRFNSRVRPALARWCGVLFSLGHGVLVMAVAIGIGAAAKSWNAPDWLEDVGAWVSIVFLALLGVLNLAAVMHAAPGEVVGPVGVRGHLLARFTRASHPAAIAAVGALFALSFDTMSQAALFALTAISFGGWRDAAVLAGLFTLGMMIADGANGLWVASLLKRADRLACIASRAMGLVVAGLSLAVAALGAARYFSRDIASWYDSGQPAVSGSVFAIVAIAFVLVIVLARRPTLAAAERGAKTMW